MTYCLSTSWPTVCQHHDLLSVNIMTYCLSTSWPTVCEHHHDLLSVNIMTYCLSTSWPTVCQHHDLLSVNIMTYCLSTSACKRNMILFSDVMENGDARWMVQLYHGNISVIIVDQTRTPMCYGLTTPVFMISHFLQCWSVASLLNQCPALNTILRENAIKTVHSYFLFEIISLEHTGFSWPDVKLLGP